jgi:hypothetical protein
MESPAELNRKDRMGFLSIGRSFDDLRQIAESDSMLRGFLALSPVMRRETLNLPGAGMNKDAETKRDRIRAYRDRAQESRRNASATTNLNARKGLIRIVMSYEKMAEVLEAALTNDDTDKHAEKWLSPGFSKSAAKREGVSTDHGMCREMDTERPGRDG